MALIARQDDAFVIAACGVGLIRRFGRLPQGERVAALAPDIAGDLREACALAFGHADSVAAQPRIRYGTHAALFDDIVLPLTSGDACALLLIARERRRAASQAAAVSKPVAACIAFAAS
ncbi:MAG TPA: hypothetical protein VG387_21465 [Rhizomicrobium sp.]|jgi:hypothetical protein|nr:hypothetical protein [Rhizomicrobium sp.]